MDAKNGRTNMKAIQKNTVLKNKTTKIIAGKRRKATKDAVAILHRRYFEGSAKKMALLEQERSNAAVARQIYELREDAGLSQRELAKLIGTTASVLCRLENADYEGHSLSMLRRIAAAVNKRVEIRFVSVRREPQSV
jgi:ribosome-binding protein aMBF1 (putative translation factor)